MTLHMKTYAHRKMDMFMVALFSRDRKWKPKGPSVTERHEMSLY